MLQALGWGFPSQWGLTVGIGLVVRHALELRSSAAHPECMILLKSLPGQQHLLTLSQKLLWGHGGLCPCWLCPVSDEFLLDGKSRTCSAGLMVLELPLLLLLELWASDGDDGGCCFCSSCCCWGSGVCWASLAPLWPQCRETGISCRDWGWLQLSALHPTPTPQLVTESLHGVGWRGP